MESWISRLSFEVKKYDRELYVGKIKDRVCVLRKTRRLETFDVHGVTVVNFAETPHLVFALTDTWQMAGEPKEWGIEPILARIKAHDLWSRPELTEDLLNATEKAEESKSRDRRNRIEDFLIDFRPRFQKAFNDVNTSTMVKHDRRRKDELKLKRSA